MAAALLATACGGSEDPGTGTKTLLVTASIQAENQVPNASSSNDFNVSIEVLVRKDNLPVSNAQVDITPEGGDAITLTEGDILKGRYTGSRVGLAASYALDVEAGADNIKDATLDSPGVHTFTAPTLGQVVPANADFQIQWSRESEADVASIKTKQLGDTDVQDTGSFPLAATNLQGDQDKQKDDEVILTRESRVGLTGGVGGSELEISIRNQVAFRIDAQP
jgi:hypothetical protein